MRQDEIWELSLPIYSSERTTLKQELENLILDKTITIIKKQQTV
jgi:hypothetical protein